MTAAWRIFMPHGHCYLWTPGVLWPSVISDLAIAGAYFSIPFLLLRNRFFPERWMDAMFAAFITACGMTHVMDVLTVWLPAYYFQNAIKVITAILSLLTAWRIRSAPTKASQLVAALEEAQRFMERRVAEATLYSQTELAEQSERLDRAESVLDSLVRVIPAAVVVANFRNEVVIANDMAESTFQKPLKGISVDELMPERFRHAHRRALADLAAGNPPKHENRVLRVRGLIGGEEVPILIATRAIRLAAGLRFIAVFRREADVENVVDVAG